MARQNGSYGSRVALRQETKNISQLCVRLALDAIPPLFQAECGHYAHKTTKILP